MKLIITLSAVVIFFFSGIVNAQSSTCNCTEDLKFINAQIQEMTSFKKQIKGAKRNAYDATYKSLLDRTSTNQSVASCYEILNTLLTQVKDKHAYIRHIKPQFDKEALSDEEALVRFRESATFKNHKRYNDDLDALAESLKAKPLASIEGIYFIKDGSEIAIVKNGSEYDGVILKTDDPFWMPGQVRYRFTPNGTQIYDLMTATIPGGRLRYIKGLYHYNGTIFNLVKKSRGTGAHLDENLSNWEFKQLDDQTQYVYFGSFSNREENVAAFKAFYEKTKDQFTAENIIVDLRNNSGGNSKYSDPFFKIFKKNKMNVFVITNFWSGSNGEQFTLKLKGLKNTVHLGDRTYGALAYGSNYGKLIPTPSGTFAIYPTDMNFHKFIDYEYVGITPDVKLDYKKDWIAQTMEIINEQLP